jgi:tetratricopeptide (TPR) repeat protein
VKRPFRIVATIVALAPLAGAQQTPTDLVAMAAIAAGLGVKCDFCHGRGMRAQNRSEPPQQPEDQPAPAFQPVAPVASSHIEIARQMMAMTNDLNAKIQSITGKAPSEATRVSCVTCHRGVAIPGQLSDIVAATDRAKGLEAAVQQYRDLRQQYYGRQSYDFGEETLITAGTALINSRPDDAIALLKLNLEFFPQSVPTYQQMAYAYTRNIDDESAIAALEKALEIQPENGIIKGRLEQLKSYRRKPNQTPP